jgi:hypothetical protein
MQACFGNREYLMKRDSELGTRGSSLKRDSELGTRGSGFRSRDSGLGTRDSGFDAIGYFGEKLLISISNFCLIFIKGIGLYFSSPKPLVPSPVLASNSEPVFL